MPFFFLQEFQKQRNSVCVKLQKVLDFAICVFQRLLICRKAHDSMEQRLIAKGQLKKGRMEEICKIFMNAVVIMGDVLVEIIEANLEFDRKVCPIGCNVTEQVR